MGTLLLNDAEAERKCHIQEIILKKMKLKNFLYYSSKLHTNQISIIMKLDNRQI